MSKQFTLGEMETIHQFFMDGQIGKDNKEFELNQDIADKTEKLIQQYQTKNFKEEIIVVSSHFSANGGTFKLRKLTSIEEGESDILDFDIENNVHKSLHGKEIGFMIEPFNYPHIEPYNRQDPFYFCSYSDLDKKEFSKFNLYLEKKRDWDRRTSTRLDKYEYNDFWNTISFDMLIEESKLKTFIDSFLSLYNMEEMREDILTYLD